MRVKLFAAEREAEYILAWSTDGKKSFPVLSTRLDLITVVDIDCTMGFKPDEKTLDSWRKEMLSGFGGALGFQNTPRGLHVYLPPGNRSELQDHRFLLLSSNRRRWQERIRESDGTWRPLPVAFRSELVAHQVAFAKAREMLKRGVGEEAEIES